MINPPLRELMKKVDSKYSLVVAASKRARQIVAKKESTVFENHKPVTLALQEIAAGKVKIWRKASKKSGDF